MKIKSNNRLFLLLIILLTIFTNVKKIGPIDFGVYSLGLLITYFVTLLVGIMLLKQENILFLEALPYNKGLKFSTFIFIIILVFTLLPTVSFLSSIGSEYFGDLLKFADKMGLLKKKSAFETIFCLAVIPAIFEELYFRGFFYYSYKKGVNTAFAIILTSFLFGIFHMNMQQFIYAFFFGIFIGILRELTGSMWAGTLFHFVNNGFQAVCAVLPSEVVDNIDMTWCNISFATPVKSVLSIIAICISLFLSIFVIYNIAKNENQVDRLKTFFKEPSNNEKWLTIPLVIGVILCICTMAIITIALKSGLV